MTDQENGCRRFLSRATRGTTPKLGLILLLALGLRLALFHGFSPHLDIQYEPHVVALAKGEPSEETNAPKGRWAIVLPTVLAYRAWGINDISSAVFPMACAMGTGVMAYLLGSHLAGDRAGLLAALFLATFPLEVGFASQLMADGPLSFWLLSVLYLLLRGLSAETTRRQSYFFVACGLALGIAYGTKIEALFVVPILAVIAAPSGRFLRAAILAAAGFLIVLLVEGIIYGMQTGEPLFRISLLLRERSGETQTALDEGSFGFTVNTHSIFMYLYWMFFDIHYVGMPFLLLAVALAWSLVARGRHSLGRACWPLLLWSIIILSILTFYPLSTSPYIPIYKQLYYILMFSAPLLVALAVLLTDLPRWFQHTATTLVVISCLAASYLSYEAHRATADNSRAIYAFYNQHREQPLYALPANVYSLQYFDEFSSDFDCRILTEEAIHRLSADAASTQWHPAHVAVDDFFIEYRQDRGYRLPTSILRQPPENWKLVGQYRRPEHPLRTYMNRTADRLFQWGWLKEQTQAAVKAKIASWSHTRRVAFYQVTQGPANPSD